MPVETTEMDAPTLTVWNLREEANDELLQVFYENIYLPAFPIVSEREDPRLWRRRLWGGEHLVELHGLIAGHNLGDKEQRQIAGGILFHYLPTSGSGLIDYVVVSPNRKRRGVGRWLMDRAKAGLETVAKGRDRELVAVFMEVNDPRRVSEAEDSMNPWARIRFFQEWGAKVVDVPYVQPELLPGQGRARDMVLLAALPRQTDPLFISARAVLEFVYEEYRAYGVSNPEKDPDCQATMKAITGPSVALYTL
jgi:GNAT superfamily N-acetyltransferase